VEEERFRQKQRTRPATLCANARPRRKWQEPLICSCQPFNESKSFSPLFPHSTPAAADVTQKCSIELSRRGRWSVGNSTGPSVQGRWECSPHRERTKIYMRIRTKFCSCAASAPNETLSPSLPLSCSLARSLALSTPCHPSPFLLRPVLLARSLARSLHPVSS
jgi:hypothetical protein